MPVALPIIKTDATDAAIACRVSPIRNHGPFSRQVKRRDMLELDIWWPYSFATSVHPLLGISQREPEMAIIYLDSARSDLERFCVERLSELMPNSREAGQELIACITSIGPIRNLTQQKCGEMAWCVKKLEDAFREEAKRLYVLCLENQGIVSAYHLVEKIETAFSKWNRFSFATKREIEEAGFCLAVERYTASGFHILRAFESEIRDYVTLVLSAKPTKRDWGFYHDTLKISGADPKVLSVIDAVRWKETL